MEGAMSQEKEIRVQIQSIENLIRNLKEQGEQAGLSQEQIQASLAPMKSQRQILLAKLEGSGAVAQGAGAKAAGERGVIAEKVDGHVVTGDNVTIQTRVSPEEDDPEALREAYLHRMITCTSQLSLTGIDPKAASEAEAQLSLSAVYTALLTLTPEAHQRLNRGEKLEAKTRRLSALEQLNRHDRLVLLGDPGSGKSTFVNFVALCLAGERLERDDVNLDLLTTPLPQSEKDRRDDEKEPQPQPWDHGTLLPVRVILRDFAARGLPEPGEQATAKHLWEFIAADLEAANLQNYCEPLLQTLLKHGGLLLLDGLDEVPAADQRRAQIKGAVEDFAATFGRCRILVTSRTYAYQKQDWRLNGFEETVLAPFNQGQIRQFVERWYEHIGILRDMQAEEAQGQAELLKNAIFNSDRLRGLAERPLLLTLMASLHSWRGGSLPEKREELYNDTVDLLLDWWESPKVVRDGNGNEIMRQPSLAEWLKVDRAKVRALLNRLAYDAHMAQADLIGTADVPEDDLVGGLLRLSKNPDVKPKRLIEYLSFRAGLLVPRGVGVYTFPHRTFQEYLAACHLTDHDYPDLVAKLACDDPNRWREVALLAGAKAARGTASAIWLLAEELCVCELDDVEQPEEEQLWGAHLAGQALVETADLDAISQRNRGKAERVRDWLVYILQENALPAIERAAAGVSLAHLGDPRPGVGLDDVGLPAIAWHDIPAGPFLMGSAEDDEQAYDWEKPQHEQGITNAYQISRYPVTNAQYHAFVKAGGYEQERFWTEVGWSWREGEDVLGPREFGHPFGLPNHPVVGVSWYEAVAFCRWLTEQLREKGELENEHVISLPTEPQWEKAARGTDGRIYPWGDEPDPDRANYEDTGIGTTSAVGCFPDGESPYGLLDMSGTVWEWTGSLWGEDLFEPDFKYPYDSSDGRENPDADRDILLVLRGGAFSSSARGVRCAYRLLFSPNSGSYNSGFRVCVSPSARSEAEGHL
jgi:formylglycine-generating enzyme required for sulfatase activity